VSLQRVSGQGGGGVGGGAEIKKEAIERNLGSFRGGDEKAARTLRLGPQACQQGEMERGFMRAARGLLYRG